MTRARDIAITAANQASAALAAEKASERGRAVAEARARSIKLAEDIQAGIDKLTPMFPGVEWVGQQSGNSVIIMEKDAPWSDPLKIKVERYLTDMNAPTAGYTTKLYMTKELENLSVPDFPFWSHEREVKSASDVGAFLQGMGAA